MSEMSHSRVIVCPIYVILAVLSLYYNWILVNYVWDVSFQSNYMPNICYFSSFKSILQMAAKLYFMLFMNNYSFHNHILSISRNIFSTKHTDLVLRCNYSFGYSKLKAENAYNAKIITSILSEQGTLYQKWPLNDP